MIATIALDLRWIRPGRVDGVGRHTASLAQALLELGGDLQYLLVFDDVTARDRFLATRPAGPAVRSAITPFPLLSRHDWLHFPRWLRAQRVDLVHVPQVLTSPLHAGYRRVFTVHDVIPWRERGQTEGASAQWKWFFRSTLSLRLVLSRADRVIAVSEASRRALLALVKPKAPVEVVPNGVAVPAASGSTADDGAGESYLLYVGRLDPHKNVEGWVAQYATLPADLRSRFPLWLCGARDPRFLGSLEARIGALGLAGQVRVLGEVDDEELTRLYRRATLLVHPSLEEGFGLTVLEAMAHGAPVVAHRIPAIEEVAAGAACLVDPSTSGGLAAAVRSLLDDAPERARLARAGPERAGQFTWRRAAEATHAIYKQAMAGLSRHV